MKRWLAQLGTTDADAFFFAVPQVVPVTVDGIRKDRFWVIPEPPFERLGGNDEDVAFVKAVSADFIQIDISVYDADGELGPKFYGSAGLTPDNGPNMGLADADNPVFYPVGFLVAYVLLLTIELFDDFQLLLLAGCKFCYTTKRNFKMKIRSFWGSYIC